MMPFRSLLLAVSVVAAGCGSSTPAASDQSPDAGPIGADDGPGEGSDASNGLCSLSGEIRFTHPVPGQSVFVSALDPSVLQADAGLDPFSALGQGARVSTNDVDTSYTYSIEDLQPGSYLVLPALMNILGGFYFNLLVHPLAPILELKAGEHEEKDFDFGALTLSGTVTFTPESPSGFVSGVVAARSSSGIISNLQVQSVLMPVVFSGTTVLEARFIGRGLRENQDFDVKLFTSLDSGNPFADALSWSLNPLSGDADDEFNSGTGDVSRDFSPK